MVLKINVLVVLAFAIFGENNNYVIAGPVAFKKFIEHEGFTCPINMTVFKKIGTFRREVCLLKCTNDPLCIGIKYEPYKLKCIGCRWYSPSIELIPTPGLEHFTRDLYRLVTENFNWWEAKANCESIGGRLADIKSAEEQTFIEENFLPSTVNLYWVGGRDNSSGFSWLDGTAISTGYQNWEPGEPNQGEGSVEYCIMLYQRSDNTVYTWNDSPCSSENFDIGSVCEFDL